MKRVVNKASHGTVAEIVARLIAEVKARGMKLFTTIDHGGEARAIGLELRETKLVVFINPRTDTPMMQAAPPAGLDLPLKVLVRWMRRLRASATPRRPNSRPSTS